MPPVIYRVHVPLSNRDLAILHHLYFTWDILVLTEYDKRAQVAQPIYTKNISSQT